MSTLTSKFNWFAVVYSIIITGAIVASCANMAPKPSAPLPSVTQPINSVQNTNKSVSTAIGDDAASIDSHVTAGRAATPPAVAPVLGPHWDGIQHASDDLKVQKGQLDSTQSQLATALANGIGLQQQIQTDAGTITGLQGQITDLKSANGKFLNIMMVLLTVLGVIGIGVCVTLTLTGNASAIYGAVGSAIVAAVSLIFAQYAMWVAIIAGVVILGALGWAVYTFIQQRKAAQAAAAAAAAKAAAATKMVDEHAAKIVQLTQVAKELAASHEVAKMAMRSDARRYMYGNGPVPGQIDIVQSSHTKDFVKGLRDTKSIRLAPSVKPCLVTTLDPEEPTIVLEEPNTVPLT